MMCPFCSYNAGHDHYCPTLISGDQHAWDEGYQDGLLGQERQSDHGSYCLGYERGSDPRNRRPEV
jgi:hypothetical protein